MAFIMTYTDPSGNGNGNTFWKADEIYVRPSKKTGRVIFHGWKSEADFLAGKDSVLGWQRVYLLTPQNFDAALIASGMDLAPMLAPCDVLALLVKDVGDLPNEGEPDTRVSFFENAAPSPL